MKASKPIFRAMPAGVLSNIPRLLELQQGKENFPYPDKNIPEEGGGDNRSPNKNNRWSLGEAGIDYNDSPKFRILARIAKKVCQKLETLPKSDKLSAPGSRSGDRKSSYHNDRMKLPGGEMTKETQKLETLPKLVKLLNNLETFPKSLKLSVANTRPMPAGVLSNIPRLMELQRGKTTMNEIDKATEAGYTLVEAVEIWGNDLTWARINTAIAKKEGMNPCMTVTIKPDDIRRKRDPVAVLCGMGHADLVKKLQLQNKVAE